MRQLIGVLIALFGAVAISIIVKSKESEMSHCKVVGGEELEAIKAQLL